MADPSPKEDLAKRDALTSSTDSLGAHHREVSMAAKGPMVPAEGDFRLNLAVPVPRRSSQVSSAQEVKASWNRTWEGATTSRICTTSGCMHA
jgi:hypothetical protein